MNENARFEPILGQSTRDELHQLLGADLCDVAEQLTAQLPIRFDDVCAAPAAGDFVGLRSAAHSIKGSVGNMGAWPFQGLLQHDAALVARLMEQVRTLVPETLAAFETFIRERCEG